MVCEGTITSKVAVLILLSILVQGVTYKQTIQTLCEDEDFAAAFTLHAQFQFVDYLHFFDNQLTSCSPQTVFTL